MSWAGRTGSSSGVGVSSKEKISVLLEIGAVIASGPTTTFNGGLVGGNEFSQSVLHPVRIQQSRAVPKASR
jgi:hypothetical protein